MQSSGKSFIVGIILVVGAVIYYFYQAGGAPVSPDSSLTSTSGSSLILGGGSGGVGSEVLALLSTIRGLNIDTSFFQSPMYLSLTDFTVIIPVENVGKANPFVPLGGPTISQDTSMTQSLASTTVTTPTKPTLPATKPLGFPKK